MFLRILAFLEPRQPHRRLEDSNSWSLGSNLYVMLSSYRCRVNSNSVPFAGFNIPAQPFGYVKVDKWSLICDIMCLEVPDALSSTPDFIHPSVFQLGLGEFLK